MANLKSTNPATPAELGFSMPAEWERHAATWLAWPHHEADWPGKMEAIRWVYGEMVRKISPGELVRILVRHKAEEKLARGYLARAGCDLKKVQFVVHPTNRGWMRDSGPVFVKRKKSEIRNPKSEIRHRHRPFSFQCLGEISGLAEGPEGAGDCRQAVEEAAVQRAVQWQGRLSSKAAALK